MVAYPTEAVFAIGCDPDCKIAVNKLLKIKNRSIKKGFILIAANFKQLEPYIADSAIILAKQILTNSNSSNNITFLFPTKSSTPYWLTGCFNSLAVRIINHPLIIRLCQEFGKPLISTSANIAGYNPCRTIDEVKEQFGKQFPIVNGQTRGYINTSEIRDALTGKRFR